MYFLFFQDSALADTEKERENKKQLEITLQKEIQQCKDRLKQQEHETATKERHISEYDLKVKALEKEANELKGDITGTNINIQCFVFKASNMSEIKKQNSDIF